uniref:Phosphotransferase n=1 Tax=Trichuris muris TaxID=70415 RepID=A0A5S6R2L2_TRIMR
MDLPERVREVLSPFVLSKETLERIRDNMVRDFRHGLEVGAPPASTAMLPSFVPALPDGSEEGCYLSMDLSGKNLRVLLLQLHGSGEMPDYVATNYLVPKEVMIGTGVQLFDFMVGCLEKFLKENNMLGAELSLGFVFSYPCEMSGIRNAKLLWWTKGFNVEDCLNQDVGQMLQDALDRKKIRVKVKAIMNDTVAQLAAASHSIGSHCTMGIVIGYGCNSAYLEEVSRIKKNDYAAAGYNFPKMIIDTEWEEFGRNGELDFIKTTYDREIDQQSVHKGRQIIDKFTGAFFLGELVRILIDQFCVDGLMFGGTRPEQLTTPDAFPTKFVSEILSDDDEAPFVNIRRIMDEMRIGIHGAMDYVIIRQVCHTVTERSASIVAAAVAALMKVAQQDRLTVGLGGALIQYHPTYLNLLKTRLEEIVPPEITEWHVATDEHGSAFGAAIIAAVAEKMNL